MTDSHPHASVILVLSRITPFGCRVYSVVDRDEPASAAINLTEFTCSGSLFRLKVDRVAPLDRLKLMPD